MAKSKVLMRVASKSNSDRSQDVPEPTARPRTAGGERGLFRRLRLGRMFLGLGSSPSQSTNQLSDTSAGVSVGGTDTTGLDFSTTSADRASAGIDNCADPRELPPLHRLFRTSSAQFQQKSSDVAPESLQTINSHLTPLSQTTVPSLQSNLHSSYTQGPILRRYPAPYQARPLESRKSNYSVLSRRSSAPDITDAGYRLSRHAEPIELAEEDVLVQPFHLNELTEKVHMSEKTCYVTSDNARSVSAGSPGHISDRSSSQGPLAADEDRISAPECSSDPATQFDSAPHDGSQHNNSSGSSATFANTSHRSVALTDNSTNTDLHSGDRDNDAESLQSVKSKASSTDAFVPLPYKKPKDMAQAAGGQSTEDMHSASIPNRDQHDCRENLTIITQLGSVLESKTGTTDSMHTDTHDISRPSDNSQTGTSVASASEAGRTWRQHLRQSMPESPISPMPSSPQPALASGGSASRRIASYNVPRDTESITPPVFDTTLILMGSVKRRGDKRGSHLATPTATNKPIPDPVKPLPSPSPSTLSSVPPQSLSPTQLPLSLVVHKETVVDESPQKSPEQTSEMLLMLPVEDKPAASKITNLKDSVTPSMLTPVGSVPVISTGRLQDTPTHRRPKSLYERSLLKTSIDTSHTDNTSLLSHDSSSMASAKAFLTMIASASDSNALPSRFSGHANNLTISTKRSRGSLCQCSFGDSLSSSLPASAPAGQLSAGFSFGHQNESFRGSTVSSRRFDSGKTAQDGETTDRSDQQAPSPGSRSLRVRSKLAGVGIRRASTYVWNRSSVFMRSLSSAEELPGSPTQQQDKHRQKPQSPQLQPHLPLQASEKNSEPELGKGFEDSTDRMDTRPTESISSDVGTTDALQVPETEVVPVASLLSKKSPAAMRLHAVRELVMTEKNFVDNLFVIKKVWMEPVFSSANLPKPIIPYQTARVIFFGIASLHLHASRFYREMDFVLGSFERSQNAKDCIIDDGMRIGALFRTNDRHWGEFIAYVRNYGTAVNCLKQLQDYKPYQRYHEECMLQKHTNRQSLKDLLMLPIQRITRYTLLLKNILKHTPAMHSDHIDLCRAVKNFTHFASIVNECRRKQEDMYRLIEIFRTIERCPPLPPSDTRTYISEFVVRELISRQPTRLLLFSDMVIVTQAPPQTKLDAVGQIESAVVEWTYYGMAQLDQVEIQNADESTNTLVTILSLNRNASTSITAGSVDSSATALSLPLGSESQLVPANTSGSRLFASTSSQNSISDAGEGSELQSRVSGSNPLHGSHVSASNPAIQASAAFMDIVASDTVSSSASNSSRKKRSRGRKGLLRVSSRDSIPEHIAALSHSTFPSPVPSPMQLNRSASRLNNTTTSMVSDIVIDKDSFTTQQLQQQQQQLQQQRPKTASGYSNNSGTGLASSMPMHSSFTLHSSSATLTNFSMPPIAADISHPLRGQPSADILGNNDPGFVPTALATGSLGRSDPTPHIPAQLTLVMQHASSISRRQFVRSLKDATKKYQSTASSTIEPDSMLNDASLSSAGGDMLNLHPL